MDGEDYRRRLQHRLALERRRDPRSRHEQDDRDKHDREASSDLFVYGLSFGNIVAGGNSVQTFQVDSLSVFQLEQITGFAQLNGAAPPVLDTLVPELALQIQDGAEARNLFSTAMPWGAVVGNAKLPWIAPRQRLFNPNQAVTLTLTSFSAASTYSNVFIGLVGAKIYRDK